MSKIPISVNKPPQISRTIGNFFTKVGGFRPLITRSGDIFLFHPKKSSVLGVVPTAPKAFGENLSESSRGWWGYVHEPDILRNCVVTSDMPTKYRPNLLDILFNKRTHMTTLVGAEGSTVMEVIDPKYKKSDLPGDQIVRLIASSGSRLFPARIKRPKKFLS